MVEDITSALEESANVGGRGQIGDRVTASQYDINNHAKRIIAFLEAIDDQSLSVEEVLQVLVEYL